MASHRLFTAAIVAALGLPVAICVLVATARLLAAMQDSVGAAVIDRLALACGIAWVLTLIGLVYLLAIRSWQADEQGSKDEPN